MFNSILNDQAEVEKDFAYGQNSSSSIDCCTSSDHRLMDWHSTREAPTSISTAFTHATNH
jgi:hypothetical protein